MTLLHRGNWKIAMYGGEHGVPHFHIEGRGFRCSIAIDSLEVIIGHAPRQVMREALAWALGNRAALRAEWQRLNG